MVALMLQRCVRLSSVCSSSTIIIIINDIYMAQVRKSQCNCEMVPQMRWISYVMLNR